MYLANPTSSTAVHEAMEAGTIGFIDTPAQGNVRPAGVTWCADNGCYSDKWDEAKWWKFLVENAHDADSCLFAVAPDVVGDAWATQLRAMPWLPKIRALGYPVAYVGQDGARANRLPWEHFDVLFIGGTTEWKLGLVARALITEAKVRGKRVHAGRVNSERRFEYFRAIGADSCDGTFLTFGPDANLPRLLAWTRNNGQPGLWP